MSTQNFLGDKVATESKDWNWASGGDSQDPVANLFPNSKCKPISNRYSFEKYSKRPELFGKTKVNRLAPIYYPDFNYCKQRTNTHLIQFNKTLGRFSKSSSSLHSRATLFNAGSEQDKASISKK